MKNSIVIKAGMVALLLSGIVVSGYADVVVINDANAGRVGHLDTDPEGIGTEVRVDTFLDAGIYRLNFQAHPVFVFQMTGVTVPADITNANFSVSLVTKQGTFTFSTDAYVIRKDASPDILASDYENSLVSLMTGFSQNVSPDNVTPNGLVSLDVAGQTTLGTWLKDNWVDGEYVFIGLKTNPLDIPDGTTARLYRYGGGNNVVWSANSTDAQLTIDVAGIALDPVVLKIMLNNGTLDFEWNNNIGKLYDLESNVSLTFSDWAVYNGYTNIARDESGINTLNGVATDGPVRFFRVKEKN